MGGHDVRDYKLHVLARRRGHGAAKERAVLGHDKPRTCAGATKTPLEAELEAVCRSAQADDFIQCFPDGYETELGQGGVNVSGGQKQRLCIARALISEAQNHNHWTTPPARWIPLPTRAIRESAVQRRAQQDTTHHNNRPAYCKRLSPMRTG